MTTHKCSRYCKIHWYYNFIAGWHLPLPDTFNVLSSRFGRQQVTVHIGPPGWQPKRPTPEQWEGMQRHCPHTQMDLSCNTCLRHTFRPWSPNEVR